MIDDEPADWEVPTPSLVADIIACNINFLVDGYTGCYMNAVSIGNTVTASFESPEGETFSFTFTVESVVPAQA